MSGAFVSRETGPNIESSSVQLASRVRIAESFWARFKGLLGYSLGDDEGLYITFCRSVHTFGMSYAIDVVFLNAAGKVLALYHGLKPWRVTRWIRGACAVLELPEGTLQKSGLSVGETVEIPTQMEAMTPKVPTRLLANLTLSALWLFFALNLLPHLIEGKVGPSAYMLFVVNSFIAILFLARREEKRVTDKPADRLITLICIFMGFSLRPAGDASLISYGVESVLLTVSLVSIFAAYLSLGRSFGLIPADRGLKQGGLYGWVRHPLYGGEILFGISFLLANFTFRNFIFTAGVFMSLHLRALAEERLLSYEPAYQAYCRKIQKRYIPFLV